VIRAVPVFGVPIQKGLLLTLAAQQDRHKERKKRSKVPKNQGA
jgi:hypothetical protein